jgi:hypothetical protein
VSTPEHNPGEPEFGEHDPDAETNPGELDFDDPDLLDDEDDYGEDDDE